MAEALLQPDGQAQKVLVLLPTDSNKLLVQWKGLFEIVATEGINNYWINMGGKEKTFHANLLKGYIACDKDASQATVEGPPTSSSTIPAASLTVIEDLEDPCTEGGHSEDGVCDDGLSLGVSKDPIWDDEFRGQADSCCEEDAVMDYIDDLLIHTETWEAHELFKRLQEPNFTVRPAKCLLGSRTVDFLGHSLGQGAIGLQDENIEKVRNASRPKTKREVRVFLRLVGYYKEFAAASAPLSDLVRKGQPNIVNWGNSWERAYNSLKVAVMSKPVLQLPDVNKKFVFRTDTSDRRLGPALMQENEGTLFPVAYASKKLTNRERKYSVTEREALAIVWGVKKFSLYLYGTMFTLQTDHGALQFLNAAKFYSPRIMRWALAFRFYLRTVGGVGSTVACESALRSAGTLLLRVRRPGLTEGLKA
ncbi:hypothetical protein PoB_000887600 [Plakobranchus ocellatus]|uniref:Reverse transcriptase RNase H-like domain-containing protein n=1 Tax=Plakobranchus ocellatus TaxID=259542 RepID=A0AAV3Y568_9GAST|nr:hypothetical protein PoB_000887600 [Plakobranchus ocellatus]